MRQILAIALLVTASAMIVSPAEAAAKCAGHRVTIHGTSGQDHINGTRHADVIDAGAGNDIVNGLGGNDIICGGSGADDLRGQAGNDRLYGGLDAYYTEGIYTDDCAMDVPYYCVAQHYRGDILRGQAGNDLLVPGYDDRDVRAPAQVDRQPDELRWDTASGGVRVNLTKKVAGGGGEGIDHIVAAGTIRVVTSRHDDTVVGTNDADQIETGAGADTVYARGGGDDVDSGSNPRNRADVVHGGPGRDDLHGASGPDRLYGEGGDDQISDTGGVGGDHLFGGPGDDQIADRVTTNRYQLYDGGGDPGDRFEPVLSVGGDATWDMVSGAMTFSTPTPTSLTVAGFHRFDSPSHGIIWDITGTDQADSIKVSGTFAGAGGDDRYTGFSGDDSYDGGPGEDRYDNDGGGTNTCTSVELDPSSYCDVVIP